MPVIDTADALVSILLALNVWLAIILFAAEMADKVGPECEPHRPPNDSFFRLTRRGYCRSSSRRPGE
jgi:hypothetical protein